MDEFWKKWAAKQAWTQWGIYRQKEPRPEVEKVVMDEEDSCWRVHFVTGDVFVVRLMGIAKPASPG
jgi:hypothetical protein